MQQRPVDSATASPGAALAIRGGMGYKSCDAEAVAHRRQ
jgi:hypothetical protein